MPRSVRDPSPGSSAAAIALADVRHENARTALAAAEGSLAEVPADEEIGSRIAADLLRLELARRTGDFDSAVASVGRLREHARALPDETLARKPRLVVQMQAQRGLLLLWAGQPDEAAASLSARHPASAEHGPECADYHAHLALAEAFRGRLHAAGQIIETTCLPGADSGEGLAGAAEVALALIHLERNELRETHDILKRADAALRARPDRLAAAAACFVAARCRLAEGRASAASELTARARLEWRLAEGRLAFSNDDASHGRRSLMKAIKLCEQQDLRLSFILEAARMRPLLRSDPQLAEAFRHVLALGPADGGHQAVPVPAGPVTVEKLSARELKPRLTRRPARPGRVQAG